MNIYTKNLDKFRHRLLNQTNRFAYLSLSDNKRRCKSDGVLMSRFSQNAILLHNKTQILCFFAFQSFDLDRIQQPFPTYLFDQRRLKCFHFVSEDLSEAGCIFG